MPSTPKPDQPKGLSALLCSCYHPSRKNRPRPSSPSSIDGDAPYARINKPRARSQMPLNTQLRLSTTTEIDIDEIGGYATILKTPIQPRKWTAQDLLITEKTHFPARADLTLPRRMSLGSGDAAGPRAVAKAVKPVVAVPEPVKAGTTSILKGSGKTATTIPVKKAAAGVPKSTSFSSKKEVTTRRPSPAGIPAANKNVNSGMRQPSATSTLPRQSRSTSSARTPSVVSRPTKLPTTPKSTTIPAVPSTPVPKVTNGVASGLKKTPVKAATKIPTSAAPPLKKATVPVPKPATKIPTTATPPKPSTPMKIPTPPKPSTPIKAPVPIKPSTPIATSIPSKPSTPISAPTPPKPSTPLASSIPSKPSTPASTPPKPSTPIFTPSKPSPPPSKPSPKPSPPSSVHSQPIIDTKSTSSFSRRSSEVGLTLFFLLFNFKVHVYTCFCAFFTTIMSMSI
uniref:WH2 domain-containing protein n=1 Tax=Panagrellus redivivus TaxID=6233 RepID=A0A7E4UQH7_PANRE